MRALDGLPTRREQEGGGKGIAGTRKLKAIYWWLVRGRQANSRGFCSVLRSPLVFVNMGQRVRSGLSPKKATLSFGVATSEGW